MPLGTHPARLFRRQILWRLNSALGATLVAALSGSKDRKISYGWAKQDGPEPNDAAVKPLQFAYAQRDPVSSVEGPVTAYRVAEDSYGPPGPQERGAFEDCR